MFEKRLQIGKFYNLMFKPISGKMTAVELTRENKYLARIFLTRTDISLFKENLSWLESQLTKQAIEEHEHDRSDYSLHGDECC